MRRVVREGGWSQVPPTSPVSRPGPGSRGFVSSPLIRSEYAPSPSTPGRRGSERGGFLCRIRSTRWKVVLRSRVQRWKRKNRHVHNELPILRKPTAPRVLDDRGWPQSVFQCSMGSLCFRCLMPRPQNRLRRLSLTSNLLAGFAAGEARSDYYRLGAAPIG